MTPSIGISAANLKKVSQVLTSVLADSMMLYIKTRKFHWNVSGESFMEYHKLFEEQYKKLEEDIDEIAERISKLGFPTIGTSKEFSTNSHLKETPGKNPNAKGMLKELLQDHESIIVHLRKYIDACENDYKDKGTADLLTALMREHETMAWKLRRYFA